MLISLIYISHKYPFNKKKLKEIVGYILMFLSYLIVILNSLSILLIIFSKLIITQSDKLVFGILDIPFHIVLIVNVVIMSLNFCYGFIKNMEEKEKYKYIVFSIVLVIPIVLFFNLFLPIIGITDFTVYTGLLPLFFIFLILYTSKKSKIYTFNYFLYQSFPYIFSFVFVVLLSIFVVQFNLLSNISFLIFPILTLGILKLGYILRSKLFFNDDNSEKDISITLSKFVETQSKDELINIYISTLKNILKSNNVKYFNVESDKYSLFKDGMKLSSEQSFKINSNEKEVVILFIDIGVFFIESESLNLIKFKEKLGQVNNLSTGFVLTMNRIRLITELESINHNFENELNIRTKSLKNSYDELQKLENAKDEFIALTSHQLKTPLTVIKGYGDMLKLEYFGKLSKSQLETIAKVNLQTENLLQISENILSVFKIKSGKFSYKVETFDLVELIQEIFNGHYDKAHNKGLEITFEKLNVVSFVIKADRYKLKQAISNLVDNAINYTEKGYVRINLNKKSLTITDSGIGIPEHFKDKLFKQFERADNARNVKPDGTGIGLYLTKKILDQSNMGTDITSSQLGTSVCIQFKE